jgi:hypothetical protein
MKIAMAALMATLLFTLPEGTAAQACGDCWDNGNTHIAYPWAPYPEYSEGHGWHEKPWDFTCDITHGICVGDDEDREELTAQLERAVERSDAAEVLDLTAFLSVQMNWDRAAVQVMSCDGETVFAHVPVSRTLLLALQELALEQASD